VSLVRLLPFYRGKLKYSVKSKSGPCQRVAKDTSFRGNLEFYHRSG
jgi:hypothetical protein